MGIELKNISKYSQGFQTLRDLDLAIPDGSFVAIVAPTGTGKTTLLRVMAGLEKPDKGSIFVDGQNVTNVHVRERNVAMVYQDFINYPSLTVYDNIASPLRVQGKLKKAEIDNRVRATAEQLRLSEYLDRLPHELSGGQQQRVAIARALIKDAKLILLDEPLDTLAEQMDSVMARLERAGMPVCSPIMNEPQDPQVWLDAPGSPKPERPPQDPVTVPYEVLLEEWTRGTE